MTVVREIRPAGHWPTAKEVDRITLPYDQRHRRRLRLIADAGTALLLDLPVARLLREGDGLKLRGGAYVHVHAAPEDLAEVTAADTAALIRLAWHLGNRHLPADLDFDSDVLGRILIRRDHVIEDMLLRLGASLRPVRAPFNPESGAYEGAVPHDHGYRGHDHHHGHDDHGDEDHRHDHRDDPHPPAPASIPAAEDVVPVPAHQAGHRHPPRPRGSGA